MYEDTLLEKLEYINNTKQLIKEAIIDIGGVIDDTTTFREYANIIKETHSNIIDMCKNVESTLTGVEEDDIQETKYNSLAPYMVE